VPQLSRIDTPTVAVVGADGRLLVPTRPAEGHDTTDLVVDDLETVAHYRRVLALDNPGSALRGRVDLTLLRRAGDGSWIEAKAETAGGDVVFEEGEQIGMRIANRSDRSVYPAVLDLGLAYKVGQAGPYFGKEELKPGASVEVLDITLGIPPTFPFGRDADTTEGGIEVVKLFAPTAPSDYTGLLQPGITRDMLPQAAAEDWTTVTRPFRLRKPTSGETLAAGGGSIEAGGVQLATSGVQGKAVSLGAGGGRTDAAGRPWPELEAVLGEQTLDVQTAIALADVQPAAGTRGVEATPPALALRPPAPAPGEGQMILNRDASGITTWHFAPASRGLDDERREYRIERNVVVAGEPGDDDTRGIGALVAKKLLKVLVFPLIEPAIGEVADFFAGKWEAKKRPYGLRYSTPDDFRQPGGAPVQPSDWEKLSGKRSLLLVHGTFSRSHSGFGELPRETFEDLYRRYEGRVIALEHPTLSETPRQNVEWLFEQIGADTDLELDIVCHSRGGLVSRTLAERQSELSLGSRTLRVRRVIFVATPNAGTALADGKHLGDLLDRYTNLLSFVPDNGVTDVLEGIVTVAKMLAVGAMKGLDGLQAMVPDGTFQKWLNAGPAPQGTTYCALAADYEPSAPALKSFLTDGVMDTIFRALGNDLVVPTDGVFAKNGAGLFPIESRHVFAKEEGVVHTKFFANRTTQEKLLTWLQQQ